MDSLTASGRLSHLPVHRGLPVPWVARWTGEKPQPNAHLRMVDDEHFQFPEVWMDDFDRGPYDVLWQPDGQDNSGEPEFGQVNTIRQVECMTRPRCQVCGERIYRWQWALPTAEATAVMKGLPTTSTPPVCSWCLQEAPRLCPHLKKGWAKMTARDAVPHAVFGALAMWVQSEEGELKAVSPPNELPIGHPAMRAMYGKQLVMRLVKPKVEVMT